LQCSLIETIECFYNGWIAKGNKHCETSNRKKIIDHIVVFNSFLNKIDSFRKYNLNAKDFYINVRCGLLHELQTKNNWIILDSKSNKASFFLREKDNKKIIYRSNLQAEIEKEFENYKKIIVCGDNISGTVDLKKIRQDFIGKINLICDNS